MFRKIYWRVFNFKWCLHCHKMTRHHRLLNKIYGLPGENCGHCDRNRIHEKEMEQIRLRTEILMEQIRLFYERGNDA